MYCPNCGKPIAEGSTCPNCATADGAQPEAAQPAVTQPAAQPAEAQPVAQVQPAATQPAAAPAITAKTQTGNYSSLFLKYLLLFNFWPILAIPLVMVFPLTFFFFPLVQLAIVIAFSIAINRAMSSIGKQNWWLMGLLTLIPFGFWIAFFVVRDQLKNAGKWGKDSILLYIAIIVLVVFTAIATIGFFAGMVLVSMGGARSKARDAKRQSDLMYMVSSQKMWYGVNKKYYTCNETGGDCQGMPNNFPETIGEYTSIDLIDPCNNTKTCGEGMVYRGLDNAAINGRDFCYYAKLESGGYFTANSQGNFKRATPPTTMEECGTGQAMESEK